MVGNKQIAPDGLEEKCISFKVNLPLRFDGALINCYFIVRVMKEGKTSVQRLSHHSRRGDEEMALCKPLLVINLIKGNVLQNRCSRIVMRYVGFGVFSKRIVCPLRWEFSYAYVIS